MLQRSALLALAALLLVASVGMEAPVTLAATSTTVGPPTEVALTIVPPRLPADGGTYAAVVVSLESGGKPSVALSPTVVYLSSSSVNVASVSAAVTIEPGQLYATANLTTTVTPGTTTITASSAGLQTASGTVTTATPSGYPYQLKVFLAPPTVISGPGYTGLVVVELLDQQGLPARAGSATVIELSTSDSAIVNVSQTALVIGTGQILASGDFSTAYVPGGASILAASSGLITGSAAVTVTGSSPLYLIVYPEPAVIGLHSTGKITVALTDAAGNPTRAPGRIVIQITSSNLTVATTPTSVVIPGGQSFAVTNYSTTFAPGSTALTFSASGLNAGAPIVVSSVAAPPTPTKLDVIVGPPTVLADNQEFDSIAVTLLDASGSPAVVPLGKAIFVNLTSSNTQVGSVPATIVIPSGAEFASVNFTTTLLAGSTTVTAFANGLQTSAATESTYGPVPSQLALQGVPKTLPADGNTYAAVEVLLEDSASGPAFAPTGVVVQLLSSDSNVVSVVGSVTIPAGSSYVLADVQTALLSGSANITAFSPGLTPATISLQTVIPAPSAVEAFVTPQSSILSATSPPPTLTIQLQSSTGDPARAGTNTLVIVSSSNSTVLDTPISIIIPKGDDYVTIPLNVSASGTTTLTAISSGLTSSFTSMVVEPLTISVTRNPIETSIFDNETAVLGLTVTVEGQPVPGVTVDWNTTAGNVLPNVTVTSGQGTTGTEFYPPSGSSQGFADVRASLTSPDFGKVGELIGVSYSAPPVKHKASVLYTLLLYLIPIVAIVAAVVAVVTIRTRRRKAREELEAGFQTLS